MRSTIPITLILISKVKYFGSHEGVLDGEGSLTTAMGGSLS
jgi:hypothetical protein